MALIGPFPSSNDPIIATIHDEARSLNNRGECRRGGVLTCKPTPAAVEPGALQFHTARIGLASTASIGMKFEP